MSLNFWGLQAQVYEFGLTGGGNNIISDIGRDDFVRPDGFYASGYYRWNINPWYSLRINGTYSQWQLADSRSANAGKRLRNWNSSGDIKDISVLLEYNFLPLNPFKRPVRKLIVVTPYLMTGVGYYITTAQVQGYNFRDGAYTLPVGFGIKFSITRRLKFHYELLLRYTFSDNLDGSRTVDNNVIPLSNPWSNDWFMTNGIGFSYGFGKLPCYLNVF